MIENHYRVVRILGLRKSCDQGSKKLDRGAAGGFTPEHAIVAFEPLPRRPCDRDRLLETEQDEVIDQAAVVGAGRIIEIRQFRRTGRIAFEQFGVVSLHHVEMEKQIGCEGSSVLVAKKSGKALHGFTVV